jgi:hypothetical protein
VSLRHHATLRRLPLAALSAEDRPEAAILKLLTGRIHRQNRSPLKGKLE